MQTDSEKWVYILIKQNRERIDFVKTLASSYYSLVSYKRESIGDMLN